MGSKELFILYALDAIPEKNTCMLETPSDTTFITLIRNQEEALNACRKFVKEEAIESIILCPHFTKKDCLEIKEAVGSEIKLYQISVNKIENI